MTNDLDFYAQRLEEELHLADAAQEQSVRRMHVKRANDYGRQLRRPQRDIPDAAAQWKLCRQSEVFGEWLADVL